MNESFGHQGRRGGRWGGRRGRGGRGGDQRQGQKRKYDLPEMFDDKINIQDRNMRIGNSSLYVNQGQHSKGGFRDTQKNMYFNRGRGKPIGSYEECTSNPGRGNFGRGKPIGNSEGCTSNPGRGNFGRGKPIGNYEGCTSNPGRGNFGRGRPIGNYEGCTSNPGRGNFGRGRPIGSYEGCNPGRGNQSFQEHHANINHRQQNPFHAGRSDAEGRQKDLVRLSKTMSYLLRHGMQEAGLNMESDGFVFVRDLLRVKSLRGRFTEEDVQRVVRENDKQRFQVKVDPRSQKLMVKANQGHTVQVPDIALEPIVDPDEVPVVIHGTYFDIFERIQHQGLSRMSRNHIHFSAGRPGDDGVVSGFRKSCQVLVYIDIRTAMQDGLKFFRSPNNVILSPGDEDGFILPKYFQHVEYRMTGSKSQDNETSSTCDVEAETWKYPKRRK